MRPRRRKPTRVSPERFRPGGQKKTSEQPSLQHTGEKLALLVLTGAAMVLVLSLRRGATLPEMGGLAILVSVGLGLFMRYSRVFELDVVTSFVRQATAYAIGVFVLFLGRLSAIVEGFPREAVPFSLATLIIGLLVGQRFALECTLFLTPWLAYAMVDAHGPTLVEVLGITLMLLAGALVAGLSVSRVRRRVTLLRVGFLVGVAHVVVLFGTTLVAELPFDGEFWSDLVLVLGHGILLGFFVSGLLPTIEYLFHATTDISLLELGNTNEHPLLRKLLLDAPGTFHHSYIVGLLCEAGAERIGANPLLARVGSLYHDIGKLNKPGYFAENSPDARARHRGLTPEMSTLIIAAHPRDGIEIGRYYDLPPSILAFMPEHHGTTRIEYFYHAALQKHGESSVVESDFRYPGPRPRSRETAICMLADAVEAISRQMPEPTPHRLREMIHEVTMKRLLDHQFDECGITMKELTQVEAAFLQVLVGIFHTRPAYPKGKAHPKDLSQAPERRAQTEEERRREEEEKARAEEEDREGNERDDGVDEGPDGEEPDTED